MIAAYQNAPAYSDRGEILLRYRMNGTQHQDAAPLSVALERPQHLRLQAYQVDLVSNGEALQARIDDAGTQGIDGQIVSRPAPEQLTLPSVLDDHLLNDVLQRGLGRHPIQLELLLAKSPLEPMLAEDVRRRLLDDRELNGRRCYRVEVRTTEGPFVFWIDTQDYVLRRFEYPARAMLAELATSVSASDMSLVAEFHDARFHAEPERFDLWEVPPTAKVVRRFVRPPLGLSSSLFGKTPNDFTFERLDGDRVSREQLLGKTVVLHWFVDHPACRASLERLQQVAERFAEREDVEIFAVSAEAPSTPAQRLSDLLAEWQVQLPIIRDVSAVGRDCFDIVALPALVVLGPDGTVQFFGVTYNPALDEQLGEALDRMARGEDLGQAVLAQAEQDQLEYRQWLAAAGYRSDLPEPGARTEPEKLRYQLQWTTDQIARAGNLRFVRTADELEVWVLSAGREIVRLDKKGTFKSVMRLPLARHEQASALRVAEGEDGVVALAVWDLGGSRVDVLDAEGRLLFAAPPPDLRHAGLRDVQWIDIEQDGIPELCVSMAGQAAVAWDLTGRQVLAAPLGGTRSIIGLIDEPGILAITTDNGRIARVRSNELLGPADPHPLHPIFELHAGRSGTVALLGVSLDTDGNRRLYGMGPQFDVRWDYMLAGGAHRTPLQWVVPTTLPEDLGTGWIVCGPDGSVHVVSGDGLFHDYFFVGGTVTGIDALYSGERLLLVIGSENEVSCCELRLTDDERPAGAAGE